MSLLIRLLLVVATAITGVLVAADAPGFAIITGMVAVALIAAVVLALALLSWLRNRDSV
ncbi:hypothetical protein ACFQU7_21835 [Pseudoroseomonas wenyumeiae]|uniref:CTP synthetase n=1 Tax=Pseudoroseomonas ludipueritiae TaxID=198093 RepID=A0ABR7RAW3_9PROT|nr:MULTISPECIES: hypothetical protein [Pseudoroseomonas]MBC9178972.1 hypothetical protein [Pseudoroseomonas ludipueritiae]